METFAEISESVRSLSRYQLSTINCPSKPFKVFQGDSRRFKGFGEKKIVYFL